MADVDISVYEVPSVAENIGSAAGAPIVTVYDAISVLDAEGIDLGDNVKGMFAQTIYFTGTSNVWSWAEDNPSNIVITVAYVVFHAAGTDTLVLRNGSTTGPKFLAYTAAAAGAFIIPTYDIKASPVFVPADGSYTLGSYFSIIYKGR